MTYLLTRPRPKMLKSQQAFDKAGLSVSVIAPVDIEYCGNSARQAGECCAQHPDTLLIVTSTFAAQALLQNKSAFQPRQPVLAVGRSSADILARHFTDVDCPLNETSEGLLAHLQAKDDNFTRVAIIKGEGGRTTIADTLLASAFSVHQFCLYKRIALKSPEQTNQWQWADVKGIIATSKEMATRLFAYYDNAELNRPPWLVVSERIRAELADLGVKNAAVCPGASDAALIAWVKENWE
ncbi:MAG TPA: uroporphyrinogen-III synthase [Oceanospirillales bacterium]|nr:uroporphyrinogen-III synthase [Oceanospirillales bacterium]